MSGRRVVVTGTATVSRAGLGTEAFWADLVRPDDRPVETDPGEATPLAFDPSPWFGANEARRLDPYLWYAVAAADLALEAAGRPEPEPVRAGVVMGNLYGAGASIQAQAEVLRTAGAARVSPWLCAVACEDACASQLSIRFGFQGPSKLVVASCASGTVAVADGAALVAGGAADLVLAGATLGPVTSEIRASYANLRVTSPSGWVRPFDVRRDGFAFAEGAAVLVLEEAGHAAARGATTLAEIVGWAQTNDAFHMSKPSGEGIERSMRLALAQAGLDPGSVRHVNAHGTGTVAGDLGEAGAIHRVWGGGAPPVTSIKGRTGHSLAASGAYEAIAAVESIRRGLLPPTATDLDIDPAVAALVDVVHGAARPWNAGPIVSNSFGLGGHNASVVLTPPG